MPETLDRLLTTLAVRLHAFAICEVKEGFRLTFAPLDAVTIHYVLAGSGLLRVGGATPTAFSRHSVMIIPARRAQSLESGIVRQEVRGEENCRVVDDGLVTFTAGDGSRDLLCACGTISADYAGALGLFDLLPGPLVQNLTSDRSIRNIFELLLGELARPAVGTQALTESLMKQCLILLLRQHLSEAGVGSPLFAGLRDERLARVVSAIVERPATQHSVGSLAAVAGMSRSSFADAFSRTFDEGPMEFVNRVRIRQAALLLASTVLPVKIIAASIGYGSRSSFSKAFRTVYGVDPSTFRAANGRSDREPRPVEGLSKIKATLETLFLSPE